MALHVQDHVYLKGIMGISSGVSTDSSIDIPSTSRLTLDQDRDQDQDRYSVDIRLTLYVCVVNSLKNTSSASEKSSVVISWLLMELTSLTNSWLWESSTIKSSRSDPKSSSSSFTSPWSLSIVSSIKLFLKNCRRENLKYLQIVGPVIAVAAVLIFGKVSEIWACVK